MTSTDYTLDQSLPASVDAERSILGAILLDSFAYNQAAEKKLGAEDFSLDSHRRLYKRIQDLGESGRAIDLITLAEELGRNKELEAIGGVAYLSSLTDGLPHRPNIEAYVHIVKDKALLRGTVHACNAGIAAAMEEQTSAANVLESVTSSIYALGERSTEHGFQSPKEIFAANYKDLTAFTSSESHPGMMTGFPELDTLVAFRPQDLIIIAARPSMGKTALATSMALKHAVEKRRTVGIFSLETSANALLMRMACSLSSVNSKRLRDGFCSPTECQRVYEALGRLFEAPGLFVDDSTDATVGQMRAKARQLKHRQKGLDLIVVDHIQVMEDHSRKHQNRTSELTAITRNLKFMAKDLDVPVVALSQLNRAVEARATKEPELSDLRESGSIEQDADIVAFIHRPEYYDRGNESIRRQAKVLVKKNRDGACGVAHLAFEHEFARFEDATPEELGRWGNQ